MLPSLRLSLNHHLQTALRCSVCHQPVDGASAKLSAGLCYSCLKLLEPERLARCECCAIQMGTVGLCGECQRYPRHFDKVRVLGDYQWPLDTLIKRFKYGGQQHLARPLAHLLWQHCAQHLSSERIEFTFVPQHWWKQWRRGFNQSELLARELARYHRQPLRSLFRRHRLGKAQVKLSARARRRALGRSFRLLKGDLPESVILIDDVVTTCSTADVLAQQLKQVGVQRVEVWAIARTPK